MTGRVVHKERMKKLLGRLDRDDLQGVVMVPGPNMLYFTGVSSLMLERPFMLLVPASGDAHLIVPTLESGPYRDSPFPINVHAWTDSDGPGDAISEAVGGAGLSGNWGVEGRVPFLYLNDLMKKAIPKLRSAEPLLQSLRETKDEAEVRLLKRSASMLSRAFEEVPELIKEGASEMELAKAFTDTIYTQGASKVDDVLVQTGSMASDPHHLPSARKIARGESIVIDVGSTYEGYYADITRTFCIGRSTDMERVYDKVLEAQESGIKRAAEGVRVGSVDAAARGVLKEAGLGQYFFHRTGHGLGLEIHEAPYILEGGKERLGPKMCFTIEPGAYIRGKLGVRIEDDVIIESRKGVRITDTPKEFGWWR